jgi:hypothetical protein
LLILLSPDHPLIWLEIGKIPKKISFNAKSQVYKGCDLRFLRKLAKLLIKGNEKLQKVIL